MFDYKGHFTHNPRAVTMILWELKLKCANADPRHLQIMQCGHGSSNVVGTHMWLGPQPNAISMNSYSCGASHMIK